MDLERALPSKSNLRHLRLEAKRRQVAGEFETLHDAQLAVAREHGMTSWAALKRLVERAPDESLATPRLSSLLSRFAGAREAGWVAPDDGELREHFTDVVLARVPREGLVARLVERGANLDAELEVVHETRTSVRARFGRSELTVVVEPRPPHRIAELRLTPVGGRLTDARVADPPSEEHGTVPLVVGAIGSAAFVDLGLVGLSLAGGRPRSPAWVSSRGWANLDDAEALTPSHRFPAYGITHPVTATTVLRLVASGRIELDAPANAYLASIRLGDDAVTVRELLSHTGGVDHPVALVGDEVPDPVELLGPVVTCTGQRGVFHYSNEGYGVLGQLIADVAGVSYPAAVDRLVFGPLGMSRSSFPTRWPSVTSDAVTGYRVGGDGDLVPEPPLVPTIPAAGGMWSTPLDLVRFGTGWATLLPGELVAESLAPRTADPRRDADPLGLGWHLESDRSVAKVAGTGPGASTSLLVRIADGEALVALCTPRAPVAATNKEIRRALDRFGRSTA